MTSTNENQETISAPVVRVFWSYAYKDKLHQDELEKHLSALKYSGYIQTWHDRNIQPGESWKQKIEIHLGAADLILLLISHDFLASDYCWNVEMQQATERHRNKEAYIVPILLSPCDYQGTPISDFQILPTGGKAITLWPHRQEAYVDVAKNIRTIVEKLLAQRWKIVGDTHYSQQHYEQALYAYEKAFQFGPQILSLSIHLGKLFLRFKRFEEAIAAYDKAIHIDPHDPYLHKEKGEAFFGLKRFEEAIAAYDKAIELKPDFGLAYFAKGQALDERAIQAYEENKLFAAHSYEIAKNLESKIMFLQNWRV